MKRLLVLLFLLWALPLLLLWALPLRAATPVMITDLSQSRVDISYRFSGAELLVYGAVHDQGVQSSGHAPDIAVILRGPVEAVTVRRKARVAGIWINTASQRFETVPGYYAIALTRPVRKLMDERTAVIYEIGTNHLQLSPTRSVDPARTQQFENGLVRLRKKARLFVEESYGVKVTGGILYRARFPIPSAVPVGNYQVETYLIANGVVKAHSTAPVIINKSGFERSLFVVAHKRPLLYGISSVLLAMVFGLIGGTVFRRG